MRLAKSSGRPTILKGRPAEAFTAAFPILFLNSFVMNGDGVSSVNIKKLVKFHIKNRKKATLIAVKPQGRFGSLKLKGNKVEQFLEKPLGDGGWVNGGFFVLNKDDFNVTLLLCGS